MWNIKHKWRLDCTSRISAACKPDASSRVPSISQSSNGVLTTHLLRVSPSTYLHSVTKHMYIQPLGFQYPRLGRGVDLSISCKVSDVPHHCKHARSRYHYHKQRGKQHLHRASLVYDKNLSVPYLSTQQPPGCFTLETILGLGAKHSEENGQCGR